MIKDFDIKISYSTVGHTKSNGFLERIHSTILDIIRMHMLEHTPYTVMAYNNSVNETHGFIPYEILFGYTSSRPGVLKL